MRLRTHPSWPWRCFRTAIISTGMTTVIFPDTWGGASPWRQHCKEIQMCMLEKQLQSPSKRNPWSLISLPRSLPTLNKERNDTSSLLHFQLHPILVEQKIVWIWNSKLSNTQRKEHRSPEAAELERKGKWGVGLAIEGESIKRQQK